MDNLLLQDINSKIYTIRDIKVMLPRSHPHRWERGRV